MSKRVLFGLALRLFFGVILLWLSLRYFLLGTPIMNVPWYLNTIFGVIAFVFGSRDLIRAYVLTKYVITGNETAVTPDSQDTVPEYGYRDQWERENL